MSALLTASDPRVNWVVFQLCSIYLHTTNHVFYSLWLSLREREDLVFMFERDRKNKKGQPARQGRSRNWQLKIVLQPLGLVLITMAYALSHSTSTPLTVRKLHRKLPFPAHWCVSFSPLQQDAYKSLGHNNQDRCGCKSPLPSTLRWEIFPPARPFCFFRHRLSFGPCSPFQHPPKDPAGISFPVVPQPLTPLGKFIGRFASRVICPSKICQYLGIDTATLTASRAFAARSYLLCPVAGLVPVPRLVRICAPLVTHFSGLHL